MTQDEFEKAFDNGSLDDEYAEFLMTKTDAMIGNGDMLIAAMEQHLYFDSFMDSMIGERA